MKQVIILMGSKNDFSQLQVIKDILDLFEISSEFRVMSAHRTPANVIKFIAKSEDEGTKIFIAAAGMAAHLAGVIAAHTTKPVIGIPIDAGSLKGLDALLSTVQMPGGIPVATVGIGKAGAKNAALLATKILALSDRKLQEKLKEYRREMVSNVENADKELQEELS